MFNMLNNCNVSSMKLDKIGNSDFSIISSCRGLLGNFQHDYFHNGNRRCFEWLFPFWKIPLPQLLQILQ